VKATTEAVGDTLMFIGYPLCFHDTVHHLPVARGASVASACGAHFRQKRHATTTRRAPGNCPASTRRAWTCARAITGSTSCSGSIVRGMRPS
jgi:hypothetical protein